MKVFSAHAEVVPLPSSEETSRSCILRARGGSSAAKVQEALREMYSPRTRR